MCDILQYTMLGGIQAGMIGWNAHFADGLAAIYIACGQDVAQRVNSRDGWLVAEVTIDGG